MSLFSAERDARTAASERASGTNDLITRHRKARDRLMAWRDHDPLTRQAITGFELQRRREVIRDLGQSGGFSHDWALSSERIAESMATDEGFAALTAMVEAFENSLKARGI